MEPGAGASWEWKPSPKIRRETETRIKAKNKVKRGTVIEEWQEPILGWFAHVSNTCCMSHSVDKKVTSSLFHQAASVTPFLLLSQPEVSRS